MTRYTLLTPGPTPLPESVLKVLSEPLLHHRTTEFGADFKTVIADLKYVYRTKGEVLMQTGSGTSAMEAAVTNLLSPGEKALVASGGVFGNRWSKILKAYGVELEHYEAEWGRACEPEELGKRLAKGKFKAVFLTHTDTSTGTVHNVQALARTVRENSDALVVVDAISGLGAEPLETDAWGLDVVVSASQKGLMNAPGLAFASVSARAWEAVEAAALPRFYWNWNAYRASLPKNETPYTPAVGLVAAQREALRLIKEEGIEKVWERCLADAEFTRKALGELGLPLFSKSPCRVLTAVTLPEGTDGEALVKALRDKHKVSAAGGQEKLKGRLLRIAHMGAIRRKDIETGLAALRAELKSAAAAR